MAAYQRVKTTMSREIVPKLHTYRSQRMQLSYCDWGNPDADTLILIHGLRDHSRAWDPVVETLAPHWHVIAPDLRGHGDSAWTSDGTYAMSGFVFDIAELVRTFGGKRVSIVGHSLGGNIALRFAAAFPELVHRLVVIEGIGAAPDIAAKLDATPVGTRMRDWITKRRDGLARETRRLGSLDDAVQRMRKANSRLSHKLAVHLTRHGVQISDDGSCVWKHDPALRALAPEDFSQSQKMEMLEGVLAPTLLVYGSDSWASSPETDGRLAYFQNAQLEMFPEAGHWVHHDAPQRFVEMVQTFLSASSAS